MAWSSYAHLPSSEEEYRRILSNLENGMSIKKVDEIIAIQKNKEKVQHHYRSNLARIGFFSINNNVIELNYDLYILKSNKNYLRTIFRKVLEENNEEEVQIILGIVICLQSYELRSIIDQLIIKYPLIEYKNFIRWLRPLVALMKFADILSMKKHEKYSVYTKCLQGSYLKVVKSFMEVAPLELIEVEMKKIDPSLDLIMVLDKVLNNYSFKFKIELLMMPSWATKNKSYKINQDIYTHIKIKGNLLKGE